ncbi:CHAP domain-containing protein [Bifidobacterium asteroides]|uniref:CHAP domain-containing protein n=1 Tax=Bifidobacterium asteroides TaxID=1684 RepID=A0A318MP46_9BIFI|nr:CHAP domain-containing protein [Bifidobacterium asteroides]PXY82365.1 CHAP domain-containing protein [Bifidobacterium asteroides]
MNRTTRWDAIFGIMGSLAMMLGGGILGLTAAPEPARADWSSYQQKVQSHAALKSKLAGVSAQLANQILSLDDLTSNQIPAAQQSAIEAQQQAQQADSLVQATNDRLQAARKDRADLEAKIRQTGIDYDDAKAGVAQMARKSFHGSETSQIMDVVTKSSSTQDFVDKMQSDAAVTRSEANTANDAAGTLNSSMNRKQRLEAIEEQISSLKAKADQQQAVAQQAVAAAQAKQDHLQALRDQGTAARKQLESQKAALTTQSAREAAEIVATESMIDSLNTGNPGGGADPHAAGAQQISSGGGGSRPSQASRPTPPSNNGGRGNGGGGASGMNYAVPGSCPSGSGFCYGHNTGNSVGGSAYPARQCTLWAYIRRSQLALPVGSYMGNGADWASTARSLGYLVNNTPHVGAAMVFARGQRVTNWNADWSYGHVAVVERVNADGSVLISEGGTGFASFPTYETVYGARNYQYIHY